MQRVPYGRSVSIMNTAVEVGRNVRAELARAECSLTRAASLMGMGTQALRRRLKGEIPFDVAELEQIATITNKSVHDLTDVPEVTPR